MRDGRPEVPTPQSAKGDGLMRAVDPGRGLIRAADPAHKETYPHEPPAKLRRQPAHMLTEWSPTTADGSLGVLYGPHGLGLLMSCCLTEAGLISRRRTSKPTSKTCLVDCSVSPIGMLEAKQSIDQSPAMQFTYNSLIKK